MYKIVLRKHVRMRAVRSGRAHQGGEVFSNICFLLLSPPAPAFLRSPRRPRSVSEAPVLSPVRRRCSSSSRTTHRRGRSSGLGWRSFARKPKVFHITAYNRRHFIMKVKSLDFIITRNLSFECRCGEGKKKKKKKMAIYEILYVYERRRSRALLRQCGGSKGIIILITSLK